MNEQALKRNEKKKLWIRGLYMLLMFLAFQISGTVLCLVVAVQFVITLLSGAPNERLVLFGRSLGRYLLQVADFQTFATEEPPFPFRDWPSVY